MTDEELLALTAKGDREAFMKLYESTRRAVYSLILSILRNPHDAEEAMQETYLKVWTAASDYTSQGKPLAWIFTIARNLCYMQFRQQRAKAQTSLEELDQEGGEQGAFCPQIESAADKLALEAALKVLKEEERQIVLLHTAAGLKHREIAAMMGLPLSTELSKYNRSMRKLEEYLNEN